MKTSAHFVSVLFAALLAAGCASHPVKQNPAAGVKGIEPAAIARVEALTPDEKAQILALDPRHVTQDMIRELLSRMPAPRIINIHGGLLPIKYRMNSFAQFLIGMGYPEACIRDPADGAYTYGYYDESDKLAGAIAWYYERDGLRPMIVGHSLGGIQAIRILHRLAGHSGTNLTVWNPLTRTEEKRDVITDPLTGITRPVVGVQVCYASAAVSGGLGRLVPGQWDMNGKLRKIPDSVEEFSGFQKGLDVLGGDLLGFGRANDYHATGTAIVRNVRLPSFSGHAVIPDTQELLKSQPTIDWINQYEPQEPERVPPETNSRTPSENARILWAAEVWHGIKKHWVLELQRLIRARSSQHYGE